jgi:lysophospholipid acyltransferase
MPIVVFVVSLSQLAYLHLENQFWRVDDFEYIDYFSLMMVLLIKLSSFGCSVFDGSFATEKLNEYQKEHAIKTLPTLLEFLGYCFFFNGCMLGPLSNFISTCNLLMKRPIIENESITFLWHYDA